MAIPYNYSSDVVTINPDNVTDCQNKVITDLDNIITDWKNISKTASKVANCKDFSGEAKKMATNLVNVAKKRIKRAEARKANLNSKLGSDIMDYSLQMTKKIGDLEKAIENLNKKLEQDN